MREYLKQETNFALTENGGAAYATTGSDCLDLFSLIGAMRAQSDEQLCRMFDRAWAEDPDLAMKILFFARDIRGGLGERRISARSCAIRQANMRTLCERTSP